jgi:hypothetical protein
MERFNGWYITGRNTESGANPSDNVIQDEE